MLVLFINADPDNGFPSFLQDDDLKNKFLNGFSCAFVNKNRTIITEGISNEDEVCAILLSDSLIALPEIVAQFLKPEMGLNICYHASNDNHRGLFSGFANKYEISRSHTMNSIYHQFAQWLDEGGDLDGIINAFFPAKLGMILDYLHEMLAGRDSRAFETKLKKAGISTMPEDESNPSYEVIYKHLIKQV